MKLSDMSSAAHGCHILKCMYFNGVTSNVQTVATPTHSPGEWCNGHNIPGHAGWLIHVYNAHIALQPHAHQSVCPGRERRGFGNSCLGLRRITISAWWWLDSCLGLGGCVRRAWKRCLCRPLPGHSTGLTPSLWSEWITPFLCPRKRVHD